MLLLPLPARGAADRGVAAGVPLMAPMRAVRKFWRWSRAETFSAVTLLALLAILGLGAWDHFTGETRDNRTLARLETVRDGVCALRRERTKQVPRLKDEIRRARAFLRTHPGGFPAFGISKADLEANIRAKSLALHLQEQTVKSLSVVECAE